MTNPNRPVKNIHLLGICGTAMAALAGALQAQGYRVTGTDEHVYPPISTQLEQLGILFNQGYKAENIPPDTDLVVVGNVIRRVNPEAVEMTARGLDCLSMAEAVYRYAIRGRTTLAVVGTHGKSTTTTLAAHVLVDAGVDPGFLIGGIPLNFGVNFRLGQGDTFVIEGDEYDTAYFDKTPKFFKYRPSMVIFTSLEFDHADIYADLEAIRPHFAQLVAGLPPQGLLVAAADDPNVMALVPQAACPVVTYGFSATADCRLDNLRVGPQTTEFTTTWRGETHPWSVPMAGDYNALNAAAVMVAACHIPGVTPQAVQKGFDSFKGIKRRQEVRGVADGVTVLDDFAHHPTAVDLTVRAIRQKYPAGTLWAVFEPRSFTARSSRFQTEFARSFDQADRVMFPPPYRPPGGSGGELLDPEQLAEAIRERGPDARAFADTDAILAELVKQAKPGDTVLIMSNGGFDNIHARLLEALSHREKPS
ncbi:MAG: Mur ligase family protein [Deltaproteobacteria bacterium]|nr:Mur ligase family protein [Deltaproteobacteria bacterium]